MKEQTNRAKEERSGKMRVQVALSRQMGEHKILNISLLARETGIPRHTIESLLKGTAKRISLDALGQLCWFFSCTPGDLLVLKGCGN